MFAGTEPFVGPVQEVSKGPPTRYSGGSTKAADGTQLSTLGRYVRDFERFYRRLRDIQMARVPFDMRDEYSTLMQRASVVEKMINRTFGAIDTVKSWIGLSGLPVIPMVAATAAVASLYIVNKTVADFLRRYDARKAVEQRQLTGGKPLTYEEALQAESAAAVESGGGSFLDKIGSNITLPLLALGAAFLIFRK